MPPIPDLVALQETLAALSVAQHPPGETVLAAGASTGRLLVLKSGAVEVVKDGVQIAKISAPGAVFGELAALLDQPHTADVRTLEETEFHVADAPTLLSGDAAFTLYVATILAQRLDAANKALIEVKRQLEAGDPRRVISNTVDRVHELLSGGISLVYAGYPYDPSATRPTASG